ncbi:MAG: PAS domain S-box protein, partial [Comamonas sp.]|nr:PAS domain S-box protein [Comamonas sp.]
MQLLQKESVLEQELQTLQEALGEVLEIGDIELDELGNSEYLDENTATHYNQFFRQMIALENRESAMDSHAIVSTADIYGNIIYANDLFCEINGMAREELVGQNHRIVASGVHPRSFFTQMWETISQGETWHGEICNRTPAGKMYWVAATIMPFMGKDGLPEKYISVRTEITAQKNLELQLAQERLFLENVMYSLNEGVLVVDTNGRCVFMNPYAENLLGWQMYEAKDQALDIVMPLFLDNAATGHIKECQLIQKISSCQVFAWDENENLYLSNRQGKKIPIAASFTPLSQEEGKSNYVITLRDITARKEYQAAILQAKEAAENASQARASFLANMSHEIRTPMNAIIGFSEALLDSPLDSSQRRQLTTVRQAGHSLLRLLNEVLDMAKLEKGAVALEITDFSLRQICQLVVDTQRLAATKKGLTLTLHYPADVPDFFKGDALRLQQILLNLLSNA